MLSGKFTATIIFCVGCTQQSFSMDNQQLKILFYGYITGIRPQSWCYPSVIQHNNPESLLDTTMLKELLLQKKLKLGENEIKLINNYDIINKLLCTMPQTLDDDTRTELIYYLLCAGAYVKKSTWTLFFQKLDGITTINEIQNVKYLFITLIFTLQHRRRRHLIDLVHILRAKSVLFLQSGKPPRETRIKIFEYIASVISN